MSARCREGSGKPKRIVGTGSAPIPVASGAHGAMEIYDPISLPKKPVMQRHSGLTAAWTEVVQTYWWVPSYSSQSY